MIHTPFNICCLASLMASLAFLVLGCFHRCSCLACLACLELLLVLVCFHRCSCYLMVFLQMACLHQHMVNHHHPLLLLQLVSSKHSSWRPYQRRVRWIGFAMHRVLDNQPMSHHWKPAWWIAHKDLGACWVDLGKLVNHIVFLKCHIKGTVWSANWNILENFNRILTNLWKHHRRFQRFQPWQHQIQHWARPKFLFFVCIHLVHILLPSLDRICRLSSDVWHREEPTENY